MKILHNISLRLWNVRNCTCDYLHEFGEGLSPDRNECSLLSSKKARNAFYGKPELRNTEAPASMLTEWLGSAARGWTGEELAWSRSTLGAWMGEARAWSREELLARSKDLAVTELNHGDDTAMVYEELVSSTRAAALFSGRTHPFRKMF